MKRAAVTARTTMVLLRRLARGAPSERQARGGDGAHIITCIELVAAVGHLEAAAVEFIQEGHVEVACGRSACNIGSPLGLVHQR